MKENSIGNLQNKKYFKNIDEAIKVYENFRRFKDKGFIKSIDPDFFFNLTDMFLSDYKRALKMNEVLLKENEEINKNYNSLIDKIILKIDEYDYKFEKAKKQNNKDKSDYYWNLIINFTKLLESEE